MPAAARRDLAGQAVDGDLDLGVLALGGLGVRGLRLLRLGGARRRGRRRPEAESLGAGADALVDDDAEEAGATRSRRLGSGLGELGEADSGDSDTLALGVGFSSANAAGATDSNASGAMTAVAAAVAMARRSFMKTSEVRSAVNSRRAYGFYG